MTLSRRILPITGLAILAAVWFAPPAHAYIDGGTASMLFQMVIAGLVASSFFIRTWWANIKQFFARLTGSAASKDAAAAEESAPVDD